MTYLELYEKASWDLAHNNITLGEFDERVKPLNQEITSVIEELEKIKAEVCEPNEMEYFENSNVWQKWFCNLIDKHISELKGE